MADLRYVILHHDHPAPHYDLMLEQGDTLRTWRLPVPPSSGQTLPAAASFAHRLAYLDYEGPVSGDRGHVLRWDRGIFTGDLQTEPAVTIRCQGERLYGTLRLERRHDDQWELTFTMETRWERLDREHP